MVTNCLLTALQRVSPSKTQEGNADGDVEGKNNRNDFSDKGNNGTNETSKDTADKGENKAQNGANKTALDRMLSDTFWRYAYCDSPNNSKETAEGGIDSAVCKTENKAKGTKYELSDRS